jgi:hypothetical protein
VSRLLMRKKEGPTKRYIINEGRVVADTENILRKNYIF